MLIRAKLKGLHSPDVDLDSYQPEDAECFGFFLQCFIGPEHEEGYDSFGVTVCTADWLRQRVGDVPYLAANHIIVKDFDLKTIEAFFTRYCERCSAASWSELAAKISRIAQWEFEDYSAA